MEPLTAPALEVTAANLALGNEVFEAQGATFVRNRSHPTVYDANHVTKITASSERELDALLAAVDREYSDCRHRRFDIDFRTPPSVAARLALEGYGRNDLLVMVLDGPLPERAPGRDIRPIESEEQWEQYGELRRADWSEASQRMGWQHSAEVAESMIALSRGKQPPVRHWLAYADGRAAAYLNSWEGTEGVGQVEDLFTHPDFRRRGLATALIQHAVADCRRNGAGPVVIVADPGDTPKRMYAALGFGPLAVQSHYLKKL